MQKFILQSVPKTDYTFLQPAKRSRRKWLFLLIAVIAFGYGIKIIFAQTNPATPSYIPLIGITAVPDPLVLPNGPGNVTYYYAVKNFSQGIPLDNVKVVDDACSPVNYIGGDDNANHALDYGETWTYSCAKTVSVTTENIATVTATANTLNTTESAYATVIVGTRLIPPLVNIINITKIAYPLSLPSGGGPVTFTYKVTNPGTVPLSGVTVTDNKCSAMSGELGDTNDNGLLDPNETWIYTCTTILRQTTTDTALVVAYANGLKAVDDNAITVEVDSTDATATSAPDISGLPNNGPNPGLPNNGTNPNGLNITFAIWIGLGIIIIGLAIWFVVIRKKKS